MTMKYYPAWDFGQIGSFVFDVTDDGFASHAYTVTISAGRYWHCFTQGSVTDFDVALTSALNAASAGAGSIVIWSVVFSNASCTYTITASLGTGNAAVTLNACAQHVLGMAASLSGATTYTSTVRPYYVIATVNDSINDGEEAEFYPEDSFAYAYTDDGKGYGFKSTAKPVHHDWVQMFEPRAAVKKWNASASVPFTYEHMFDHCGLVEPILMVNSDAVNPTYAADVSMRFTLRDPRPIAVRSDPPIDTTWNVSFFANELERLRA